MADDLEERIEQLVARIVFVFLADGAEALAGRAAGDHGDAPRCGEQFRADGRIEDVARDDSGFGVVQRVGGREDGFVLVGGLHPEARPGQSQAEAPGPGEEVEHGGTRMDGRGHVGSFLYAKPPPDASPEWPGRGFT